MRGLNKVSLIGNLGKNPEIKLLAGNLSVTKLTIATTDSYKDKNGKMVQHTEWHNVVLWRGLAELAHTYLVKGSSVFIEGKIQTRSYKDLQGVPKNITEIIADQLIMLDKKEVDRHDFIPI